MYRESEAQVGDQDSAHGHHSGEHNQAKSRTEKTSLAGQTHGRRKRSGRSGLAGPVFGMAHAQKSNNVRKSKNNDHTCTTKYWPPAAQLLKLNCSNAKLPAAYTYLLPARNVIV